MFSLLQNGVTVHICFLANLPIENLCSNFLWTVNFSEQIVLPPTRPMKKLATWSVNFSEQITSFPLAPKENFRVLIIELSSAYCSKHIPQPQRWYIEPHSKVPRLEIRWCQLFSDLKIVRTCFSRTYEVKYATYKMLLKKVLLRLRRWVHKLFSCG